MPSNRQFTVISGSPISKESRYRRSPSPRIVISRTSSSQSSPSPCPEEDPFSTWISAFQPLGGRRALKCYKDATVNPPISKSSLGELEVGCIISNPKLRHDINFDRELHFRPNLDGERGRRKLLLADEYWLALEPELEKYSYMLGDAQGAEFRWSPEWLAEFRRSQKRLPRLFDTIKDILVTLTPDQEVPSADDALDVPLIMQQIERGVYDLSRLATWLASLLKAHCAPMRDQWVEKMVDLLSRGGATFNAKLIVDGLKELFGIMEAMKLVSFDAALAVFDIRSDMTSSQDIANHQIRYFRPMLLEHTVRFEQRYYAARIADGHIDTSAARNWLNASEVATASTENQPHDLTAFTLQFLTSLLSSNPTLPETFTLDHDRLLLLRSDAHALVYSDICLSSLNRLLAIHVRPNSHSTRARSYLRSILPMIVGRGASDSRWTSKAGHIAVEIVRAALGRFPDATEKGKQTVEIPAEEQQSGATEDGAAICQDLESYLTCHLRPDSELFQIRMQKQRSRLITRVSIDAQRLEKLSLREIDDALLAPRTTATASSLHATTPQTLAAGMARGTRPAARKATAVQKEVAVDGTASAEVQAEAAFEDVVARSTHIAVLHWRVWAPLVYAKVDGAEASEESEGDVMDWEGDVL